jgi:geranylgeranyl reductase family protein
MHGKVSIIGAGTAGLVAGRDLASAGISTTIYDQKEELGIPVRASGIISINGLKMSGIAYESAVTNTLRGARIHAGSSIMKISAREPVAKVLDRKRLSDICEYEADHAGAKIVKGRRITGHMIENLHRNSIMIGADGAVSNVAKHFGMGPVERYVLTYKAEFNVDIEDPDSVDLFFDKKAFPGLFAWTCPNAKDLLEVGVGVDSGKANSKKAIERFIAMKEVKEMVGDAKMIDNGASMIPLRMRKRIVDPEKRVLLVGDAAGQVKGTTGGGIVYGSAAAIMAAKAIRDNLSKGKSLSEYERMFVRRYGSDLRLHGYINRFYSSLESRTIGRIIGVMNFLGMDSFVSKYGDMDLPSLLIKRFFLRGLI